MKVLGIHENKQGHFLSEEQKQVKQKIMEDMIIGFFDNVQGNMALFDMQSLLDLTFSILIMLNREILVHTFKTFNLQHCRKQIMKDIFQAMKDQVDREIKESMQ